jgi:hypothetical protein
MGSFRPLATWDELTPPPQTDLPPRGLDEAPARAEGPPEGPAEVAGQGDETFLCTLCWEWHDQLTCDVGERRAAA